MVYIKSPASNLTIPTIFQGVYKAFAWSTYDTSSEFDYDQDGRAVGEETSEGIPIDI